MSPLASPPTSEELRSLGKLISSAIQQKSQGSCPRFDFCLHQLRTGGDAELNRLFLAMSTCVSDLSHLTGASEALVTAALAVRYMPVPADGYASMEKLLETAGRAALSGTAASNALAQWTSGGGIIYSILTAKSHLHFMTSMISASPVLLPTVCRALLRCLTESQAQADKYAKFRADVETSKNVRSTNTIGSIKPSLSEKVSGEMSWLLSNYQNMVYDTICEIMQLVPTGISTLHSCIVDVFPHRRFPIQTLRQMTHHVLLLAQRLPALRDRLISYLVDRAVDLDVNIPLELLPDVDGEGDSDFEDDPTEPESGLDDPGIHEPSDTTDTTAPGTDPAVQDAILTANKLDMLLLSLFRFLHFNMCGCSGLMGRRTYEDWIAPVVSREMSTADGLITPRPKESSESIGTSKDTGACSARQNSFPHLPSELWNAEKFALEYRLEDALHLSKTKPLWTVEEGIELLPHPILNGNEGTAQSCSTLMYINASTNGSIVPIDPPSTLFFRLEQQRKQQIENKDTKYSRSTMRAPSPQSERLFALVLGCFERSVLLTHKSKYTQFLLFYVAGLHPAFTDRLVGRLIAQVRHQERTLLLRAFAASYLGSLLARAAYVDDTTLRSALFYCAEWAHGYIDVHAAHALYSLARYRESGREGLYQLKLQVDAAESQMRRNYKISPPADGKGIWWKIICQRLRSLHDTSDLDDSWSVSTGRVYKDSMLHYDFMDFDTSMNYSEEPLPLPLSCLILDPELPPLPPVVLFTSFLQAAFYALCFRSSYFHEKEGGVMFLRTMQWGRLLRNRAFDPLAACGEVIGREFVRVAHALRLVTHEDMACSMMYPVLTSTEPCRVVTGNPVSSNVNTTTQIQVKDTNHGHTTVSTLSQQTQTASDLNDNSGHVSTAVDVSVLESFFPFDPYLLKTSMPFIAPIYRTWQQSRLPLEGSEHWLETDGYDTSGVSDPGQWRDVSKNSAHDHSWCSSDSSVIDDMSVHSQDSSDSESSSCESSDESETELIESLHDTKTSNSSLINRMRAGMLSNTSTKYSHRGSTRGSYNSNSAFGSLSLAPGLAAMVNDVMDTEGLLADLDIVPATTPFLSGRKKLDEPSNDQTDMFPPQSPPISPSQESFHTSTASLTTNTFSPFGPQKRRGQSSVLLSTLSEDNSALPAFSRSNSYSARHARDIHHDDDSLVPHTPPSSKFQFSRSPFLPSARKLSSVSDSSYKSESPGVFAHMDPSGIRKNSRVGAEHSSQGTTPLLQAASAPWLLPPLTSTSPASIQQPNSILRSRGSSISSPFQGAMAGVPGFEGQGLKRPRRPSLVSPLQGPIRSALHSAMDTTGLPPSLSLGESMTRAKTLQPNKSDFRIKQLSEIGRSGSLRSLLLTGGKVGNKTPLLNSLTGIQETPSDTKKVMEPIRNDLISSSSSTSEYRTLHTPISATSTFSTSFNSRLPASEESGVPNYSEFRDLLTKSISINTDKGTPTTALGLLQSPRSTTENIIVPTCIASPTDRTSEDGSTTEDVSDISTSIDIPLIRGSKSKSKRIVQGDNSHSRTRSGNSRKG